MATKRIKVLRNAPMLEKEIARGEATESEARVPEMSVGSTHAARFDATTWEALATRPYVPAEPDREVVIEYDLRHMTTTVHIPDMHMLIPREVIAQLRYNRPVVEARGVLVEYIMGRVHDFVASAVHRMDRL